ncbi:MAG: PspC domain-containing protein [Flavobacteriia bacterium]|jgi:phage shock protein PspC (stress-responsive transcriptional regulator)
MKTIQKILFFFEMRSFGVCSWWARKLGISISKVRLGFIYASFIALGSPLIIYLAMAWILEHKHFFKLQRSRRNSIWEL